MRRWLAAATLIFFGPGMFLTSQGHAERVSAASAAGAVNINFNGVADGTFTKYRAGYFVVWASQAEGWQGWTGFGDPAPSIGFVKPNGSASTKRVLVTRGGKSFTFKSVALYSSITTIPYGFRGILNGLTKYVVTGTVPNTFGAFKTVANRNAGVIIDTLVITVTNPKTCCTNPMGIDNIVVMPAADLSAEKPH